MILFLFISLGPGFDLALPRTHVSGVARLVMAAVAVEASPEEDHAARNAVSNNLDKVMVTVLTAGMPKMIFWLTPTTPLSRLIDWWCTRTGISETKAEFIYTRPATRVRVSISGQETVATLEQDYEQKNQLQILAAPRFLDVRRNDNY